jgi:Cys-tRNA(Pro)/Cys-tRNA(Cys) deacylase
MIKTNAVRILDRLAIRYELREYGVNPSDLSAETVAAKIGLPPEQVFKTLAVHGDRNGICLAVISADQELDFKALAHQTGDRKIDLVPLKEVQPLTGYVRGGVTALACKKDYPAYIDDLAEICEVISVSAGIRGLQILLATSVQSRPRSQLSQKRRNIAIRGSGPLTGRHFARIARTLREPRICTLRRRPGLEGR